MFLAAIFRRFSKLEQSVDRGCWSLDDKGQRYLDPVSVGICQNKLFHEVKNHIETVDKYVDSLNLDCEVRHTLPSYFHAIKPGTLMNNCLIFSQTRDHATCQICLYQGFECKYEIVKKDDNKVIEGSLQLNKRFWETDRGYVNRLFSEVWKKAQ